jgi:uncharacterized protein with PhoU and TrkA domain
VSPTGIGTRRLGLRLLPGVWPVFLLPPHPVNELRSRLDRLRRELEGRIQLAARLYRHARSMARDVADGPMQSEELAAATRAIGEAVDRALRGEDATAAIAAAVPHVLLKVNVHGPATIA